jgi:hypothetical protein
MIPIYDNLLDVLASKITCKNVHTDNGYSSHILISKQFSVLRGKLHSLSSPASSYHYKDCRKNEYWIINNIDLPLDDRMLRLNGIMV